MVILFALVVVIVWFVLRISFVLASPIMDRVHPLHAINLLHVFDVPHLIRMIDIMHLSTQDLGRAPGNALRAGARQSQGPVRPG